MSGTSLRRLEEELAGLEADIAHRAMELVRGGASPEELLVQLKPLTTRSVELKDRIRDATPWHRLRARRHELQRMLAALPEGIEHRSAQRELMQLNLHLHGHPRRRPMTLLALLVFATVVCAMVVVPPLVVDWLAP